MKGPQKQKEQTHVIFIFYCFSSQNNDETRNPQSTPDKQKQTIKTKKSKTKEQTESARKRIKTNMPLPLDLPSSISLASDAPPAGTSLVLPFYFSLLQGLLVLDSALTATCLTTFLAAVILSAALFLHAGLKKDTRASSRNSYYSHRSSETGHSFYVRWRQQDLIPVQQWALGVGTPRILSANAEYLPSSGAVRRQLGPA
jgi:hypothetical protein